MHTATIKTRSRRQAIRLYDMLRYVYRDLEFEVYGASLIIRGSEDRVMDAEMDAIEGSTTN